MNIFVLFLAATVICMLSSCAQSTYRPSVFSHARMTDGVELILNERQLSVEKIGVQTLLASPQSGVDFEDPRSVLKYVMEAAGDRPTVYPTERYYYYQFPLGSRAISGNIRFSDVENGTVSVGYFDSMHNADMRYAEYKNGDPGIHIEYDQSSYEIDLKVDDASSVFTLDQSAFVDPEFLLFEDEKYISGIRDESGYYLHLLYWPVDRSFYYVLNEGMPQPERMRQVSHGGLELYFGEHSRFCFYKHESSERLVLVGVHRRSIQLNTWFDGPFDQVPPNLMIKDILEEAYPYVIDAGGIDDHGAFLEREGQRIAISPYIAYRSGPELIKDLVKIIHSDKQSPAAWTKATYEYKKDWRAPDVEGIVNMHHSQVSAQWPANHWGASSRGWGTEHDRPLSRQWPANHERGSSTLINEKN